MSGSVAFPCNSDEDQEQVCPIGPLAFKDSIAFRVRGSSVVELKS